MSHEDDDIFAALVHEEIDRCSAEVSVAGVAFKEELFAKYALDVLSAADVIEDGTIAHFAKPGMKVNGYNFNEAEDTLDLFVCSSYSGSDPPQTYSKTEVDSLFSKVRKFFESALNDLIEKVDEASEAFDLIQQIHHLQRKRKNHVRFFVILDGYARDAKRDKSSVQSFQYSWHAVDLRELQRHKDSGKERKPVNINFFDDFGERVPCLPVVQCDQDFEACIALLPGELLCRIYDLYGSRLLERNIRSFLRATGKINRKIKNTILETPGRFLSYNNGISCTAEAIEFAVDPKREKMEGREWRIESVKNFQIVNGGQTTASLYNAYKRYKADLSKVYVQAKISIVKDPAILDETVSKIALYANSQNKVSESDFYALDTFHVKVEEYSRNTWAPPSFGKLKMKKWYYERARGAYLDDRARAKRVTSFDAEYPKDCVFTKTDLAVYESVWSELPYVACLGEQKNFGAFTLRAAKESIIVDQQYFKELVAKCLLYRAAVKLVKELKLPAYKAQTARYSVAYVLSKFRDKLDLKEIWKKQAAPEWFVSHLAKTIPIVHKRLSESDSGKNVTEWCKKEACWQTVRQLSVKFDSQR